MAKGFRKVPNYEASEAVIQKRIRGWARAAGYFALRTTHVMRPCWNCNEWPSRGYGADAGVPDLLIAHEKWPKYVFLGLEVKSKKGGASFEQRILRDAGRIAIVRSLEEAQQVVEEFERLMEVMNAER